MHHSPHASLRFTPQLEPPARANADAGNHDVRAIAITVLVVRVPFDARTAVGVAVDKHRVERLALAW
eukprot:3523883-Rhodomonas_salina.2